MHTGTSCQVVKTIHCDCQSAHHTSAWTTQSYNGLWDWSQTQHGGSAARQSSVATARFGDEEGDSQLEDIPEEQDMENPPQAAEKVDTSKSIGKEGEGSQDEGKPATAPPEAGQDPTIHPPQPQASTSKYDTQAPPQDPTQAPPQDPTQDPINNPSENERGLAIYTDSFRQATKIWFDTVQVRKE